MVKKFGSGTSTKEVLTCPSTFAWQWPSCGQPRTLSFREDQQKQYKTMNSTYSVDCSCFSSSNITDSFEMVDASEEADAMICALRSDRLFFEPDASSCIFKQADSKLIEKEEDNKKKKVAFGGATAMSVESQNPYRDFRESMEAMVMSHSGGVKDWSWLEEMLSWYLRANAKNTHGLIVGAFVDLLVSLSNTTTSLSSSPVANCSSSSSDDNECSLQQSATIAAVRRAL